MASATTTTVEGVACGSGLPADQLINKCDFVTESVRPEYSKNSAIVKEGINVIIIGRKRPPRHLPILSPASALPFSAALAGFARNVLFGRLAATSPFACKPSPITRLSSFRTARTKQQDTPRVLRNTACARPISPHLTPRRDSIINSAICGLGLEPVSGGRSALRDTVAQRTFPCSATTLGRTYVAWCLGARLSARSNSPSD